MVGTPLIIGFLVVAIMAAMLLRTAFTVHASQGMVRSHVMMAGTAALGILAVPNIWLQGLLSLYLINLLRDPHPGVHMIRAYPVFLMAVVGSFIVRQIGPDIMFWGLLALVVAGAFLGAWSLVSWYQWPLPYQYGKGVFQIWDEGAGYSWIHAGQENPNNLASISAVCSAAVVGMAWIVSWWWLVALPFTVLPIVLIQRLARKLEPGTLTQGPILLVGAIVAATPLVLGWWSLAVVVPVFFMLLWGIGQAMRYPQWLDSGRVRAWIVMLTAGWWQSGWTVRLFGRGWQSWLPYHDHVLNVATKAKLTHVLRTEALLSTAHNEYVQTLFEHGGLALLALTGYLATTFWRLGHGSIEAQAVYLVGMAICGVACVIHPWTAYHHTATAADEQGKPDVKGRGVILYSIGSPALNWMSFLIICMAEAIQ